LLIMLRAIRSFAYGFLNTSLGFYMSLIGYGLFEVGLVTTVAGSFSAALIVASGVLADRLHSRKTFLTLSGLLMVPLGLLYAFTTSLPLLLLGAAIGGAGSAGGGGPGGGPFGPAQQALLADKVADERRHRAFSINAFAGTLMFSAGAVVARLPRVGASMGLDQMVVYRWLLLTFAAIGAFSALIPLWIREAPFKTEKQRGQKGKLIGKFTVTAILNGFGMGLIPTPLITLWFSMKYGVSEASVSLVIGAANLAGALSYIVAPRLAKMLGTVNMIVSTRAIGVVLLAVLPFISSFPIAAVAYTIRGVLSSVGFPIRQSYMMGVVDRDSRSTAVGISSGLGWGLPYAVSPVLSGVVMEEVSSSLPLFVSAGLQGLNSLVYYTFFRHLKPPEETNDGSTVAG